MSEENKWVTDLPDEDKNASAEQKPLTHPYSEGRRMQESRQDSYAGAGQSEGTSQENTDIMRCTSLRPVIMPVEIYRPKSRGKREIFQATTALERKQPLRWPWL